MLRERGMQTTGKSDRNVSGVATASPLPGSVILFPPRKENGGEGKACASPRPNLDPSLFDVPINMGDNIVCFHPESLTSKLARTKEKRERLQILELDGI